MREFRKIPLMRASQQLHGRMSHARPCASLRAIATKSKWPAAIDSAASFGEMRPAAITGTFTASWASVE